MLKPNGGYHNVVTGSIHTGPKPRQSIPIQLTFERGQSALLPKLLVGFYGIDYGQYTINPQQPQFNVQGTPTSRG